MGTVTAIRNSEVSESTSDLLVVKADGEIQCHDGKTLQVKWTSPPSALVRDSSTRFGEFMVEFAHLTNAHSASQGIEFSATPTTLIITTTNSTTSTFLQLPED